MKLQDYYSEENGIIEFTREQASGFAKKVAGDYNPIHNPDSKRFCVPGDLLFACSLKQFGLSKNMSFKFSGMVNSGIKLDFKESDDANITISNLDGKAYLSFQREGELIRNGTIIDALIQQYVEYSGHSFPDILVPLMAEQQVMINPDRPLVIYESMSIQLTTLYLDNISLQREDSELKIDGKRGEALLRFKVLNNAKQIGSGYKSMLLSGLRAYDEAAMSALVSDYIKLKTMAN